MASPSGLAAAAAAAEVEVEAGPAAAANADASSLSSACFTELKRPVDLRVAGARLDILIFFFAKLQRDSRHGEKKRESSERMKMFFFLLTHSRKTLSLVTVLSLSLSTLPTKMRK